MNALTDIKRSPAVFAVACVAALFIIVIRWHSYLRSINTLDQLEKICNHAGKLARRAVEKARGRIGMKRRSVDKASQLLSAPRKGADNH